MTRAALALALLAAACGSKDDAKSKTEPQSGPSSATPAPPPAKPAPPPDQTGREQPPEPTLPQPKDVDIAVPEPTDIMPPPTKFDLRVKTRPPEQAAAIKKVILSRYAADLKGCGQTAKFAGIVPVGFVSSSNGHTTDIRVRMAKGAGADALIDCISQLIPSWRFTPVKDAGGQPADVKVDLLIDLPASH
ncbi:MAG TPA: hypothetical protein VL172_15580 [Kofleriaceae bacterium]|nr:hypothetical protein [Kofleriaceae bacterium]